MRRLSLILGALALACGSPQPSADGGTGSDAGSPPDAGRQGSDAGRDAGVIDGGFDGGLDAGHDAGVDAGSLDAGGADAGGMDGGSVLTLNGYVYDLANNRTPLSGVQVSVLNGSSATTTDSTGNFHLVVPPNLAFTAQLQDPTYATLYLPQLDLSASYTSPVGLPMFSDAQVTSVQNALPGFNAADGLVFGSVTSLAATGPCTDESGWTFQISPSGGESVAYLDSQGNPDFTLTSTSSFGFALIYNVNPAATPVLLSAAKPDAGCAMPGMGMGVTGYVEVAPQVISLGVIFIQ